MSSTATRTRNRIVLVLLFALFFAPIAVALLLNSKWVDWTATPARAHGELLQPVQPLGEFALPDAYGEERSLGDLAGRWHLVMTRSDACGDECKDTLLLMHNIRLAQDRRASEAGLLLLTSAALPESLLEQMTAIDPTWRVFDETAGAQLMARFPDAAPRAFYIVDPEGNIIERFASDADPTGIRKDLDRLLTWTVRE